MRISARNQFPGTLSSISEGAVNDEATLDIGGGLSVVATVTASSRAALGLVPGRAATALVKASSVILMIDGGGARLSARNQLPGRVSRLLSGSVNCEVTLDLGAGRSIVAIITHASASALALDIGNSAVALFKASSVLLAVDD